MASPSFDPSHQCSNGASVSSSEKIQVAGLPSTDTLSVSQILLIDERNGVVGQGLPGGGVGERLVTLGGRLHVGEHCLRVEAVGLAHRVGELPVLVLCCS